jgi:quaternary ammonium compound-resistance protein SugE
MSGWGWLALAGIVEVAWSQSIRATDGFTRPWPTLLCLALAVAAIVPLSKAMEHLPVGTAYVVFTGIGGVGAVALGILAAGEPLTWARVAGASLVIAGVATLRAAGA